MKTKKTTLIIVALLLVLFVFPRVSAFAEGKKRALGDHIYAVCFVNDKEGWAAGARGSVQHTLDGGLNWEKQLVKTNMSLLAISFCNSQVGWVAGKSGAIFHTTDGGKSWTQQPTGTETTLFGDRKSVV